MDHEHVPRRLSRRHLLLRGGAAAALTAMPQAVLATTADRRHLSFHNLHTGEQFSAVYWVDGRYLAGPLEEFAHLCRDFRTDEVHALDRGVLDFAFAIQRLLRSGEPVQLISGYRSPKTNAMLAKRSPAVAKKSLHMQGRALDIRLPGRSTAEIYRAARKLKLGGAGLYSSSGFVHIDTGRVRFWGA